MQIHPGDRPRETPERAVTRAAEFVAGRHVADVGGWAVQRLAVVRQAGGVCARCGTTGADTAFRSWDGEQLLAGHTRCVVGLGPATGTARR